MTFPYIPHLILAGLVGIHSEIITVSKVSVKAGGSISIPCLYELHYTNHVKYLCKGHYWLFCTVVVKSNQPSSGRFSLSDDTSQRIFTVTIHDLTDQDASYWCAVEINKNKDVKQYFLLSVTTGMSSLYVDQQEVVAPEGGSVTVVCYYEYPNVTKWCRLGSTCVTDQTGSIGGTTVTVNASVPNVFIVTMSELKAESSGWYWCTNGVLQMPVHVTVHELSSPTTTTMNPNTANFTETFQTTTQHSSSLTSAEPYTSPPTNSTINGAGGGGMQDEHKSSTKVTILITILVLQLLVVPAAIFGWRMIRRRKSGLKTNPEGADITAGSQTGSDPDVLYATVVHQQGVAEKQNHIPQDSVTYSTIVIKDDVRQRTEPADGSVIHSTPHTKIQ